MSTRPIVLLIAGLSASSCPAGILWEQSPAPPPGGPSPYWSSVEGTVGGFVVDRQAASDVDVTTFGWTMAGMTIWGAWASGENRNPANGFRIRIFESEAGVPALSPHTTITSADVTRFTFAGQYGGLPAFRYEIDFEWLFLAGGKHFVSVQALDGTDFFRIVASENYALDSFARDPLRNQPGGGGSTTFPENWAAFESIGGKSQDLSLAIAAVPEPHSWAVVAAALSLLATRRKVGKQRNPDDGV
ncbi:MAG: hypothetical protein M3R13_11195 [Armatimonadota bacterium]|nr:hypothetical protein [Armatimonadota bacterium]